MTMTMYADMINEWRHQFADLKRFEEPHEDTAESRAEQTLIRERIKNITKDILQHPDHQFTVYDPHTAVIDHLLHREPTRPVTDNNVCHEFRSVNPDGSVAALIISAMDIEIENLNEQCQKEQCEKERLEHEIEVLRERAMVMQVAVSRVLEVGGLDVDHWFDHIVTAQRFLSAATRKPGRNFNASRKILDDLVEVSRAKG